MTRVIFISLRNHRSGKEKAHKHKQFGPVTVWVREGGLPTGWPGGSNVYVLCAEPKEHKHFIRVPGREERWPRWPRKCLYVSNVYVPFLAANREKWITESLGLPYRNVLEVIFGNFGGRMTELILVPNWFGNFYGSTSKTTYGNTAFWEGFSEGSGKGSGEGFSEGFWAGGLMWVVQ